MTGPEKKKPKQTVAHPSRPQAIVVGVVDQRQGVTQFPPEQLDAWLLQDGVRVPVTPKRSPGKAGPSAFARFEPLAQGKYEAHALRRAPNGRVVATAQPGDVTLGAIKEGAVDLTLHAPPRLELVEARFVDDHALLVASPPPTSIAGPGGNFQSTWGDGASPSATPLKPEYLAASASQHPVDGVAIWHPASYSLGNSAKLHLVLRPIELPPGAHTLTALSIEPLVDSHGERACLTFEAKMSKPLAVGHSIPIEVAANEPLPTRIQAYSVTWRITAVVDAGPVSVERDHRIVIYATWARPTGKVLMHPSPNTTNPFPEAGPEQSVTHARLHQAVIHAAGAETEEEALKNAFDMLKTRGVYFDGAHRYPTQADIAAQNNTSGLDPLPDLHEFLWIALDKQATTHCSDLAAAFRLLVRILGIGGDMSVREVYPWPPWVPGSGQRRPVFAGGWPGQGSLKKYNDPTGADCVFFDGQRYANRYEGVLRWVPTGSSYASLYAIGERICDLRDPAASPDEMDERNASYFFQSSAGAVVSGRFLLGMLKGTELRRPAFDFLNEPTQTLFMFHYDTSTFNDDDDRQVVKFRLPKKKSP